VRNLEAERKRFLIMEDDYSNEQKNLDAISDQIKLMIPNATAEHRDKVKFLSLKHQYEVESVRLQDTIGENNYLKIEIDIMRKEILFAKDNIRTMNEQIQDLRDKSTKAQQKSSQYSKQTADSNNWILSLKAKSEASKIQFENQVKQLQGKLQERQDQNEVREDDMDKSKNEKGKFDNPTAILNIRLENITAQNKEKKRLLDLYMRNAQVIEQAFQVMREGSGINSTDEIVTSFIKAEEQQYALWNYQNQLT
jgi:hypothetical protein